MGIDPATKKYVPFDIVDKKFASNYMNLIIHPLERQGVDFWWLDWQAWGTTKIPGVTPTWWLNYVFFTDMERKNADRPLLFHRWGGLGNHRYQIGFSGDVVSVWESLAFQPRFTATAANVGYGYGVTTSAVTCPERFLPNFIRAGSNGECSVPSCGRTSRKTEMLNEESGRIRRISFG